MEKSKSKGFQEFENTMRDWGFLSGVPACEVSYWSRLTVQQRKRILDAAGYEGEEFASWKRVPAQCRERIRQMIQRQVEALAGFLGCRVVYDNLQKVSRSDIRVLNAEVKNNIKKVA